MLSNGCCHDSTSYHSFVQIIPALYRQRKYKCSHRHGKLSFKTTDKEKGTKALRMEAEILEFLHKEKNIKKTQ